MKITLEPKDYLKIRDVMTGVIDFVPTDGEIDLMVRDHDDVVALAFQWGWNETETRDRVAELLEDIHRRSWQTELCPACGDPFHEGAFTCRRCGCIRPETSKIWKKEGT